MVKHLEDVVEDTSEIEGQDSEEETEVEGNLDDEDFKLPDKLFYSEDEDEEDPEEEELAEEEVPEPDPEPEVDEDEKPKFTQKDLDRIIGQARIKGRELENLAPIVHELKEITGMDLPQIVEFIRNNQVTQVADEKGWTEDEAREYVNNQRRAKAEESRRKTLEEQNKTIHYTNQKILYLNNPKVSGDMKAFARQYEAEIDAFSDGGRAVDYDVAVKFILGEKLQSGEIQKRIRNGAEQKTLANVQKRSKVAPVTGSQGGKSKALVLSQQEKEMAKMLGVSPQEVMEEKRKIEKERRRR